MQIAMTLIGVALICLLLWGLKIIRQDMSATERENFRLEKANKKLREENFKLKRNG